MHVHYRVGNDSDISYLGRALGQLPLRCAQVVILLPQLAVYHAVGALTP